MISGSTGFLGSRIAELFIEKGHQVLAIVRKESSLDRLDVNNPRIRLINSNRGELARIFKEIRIDYIIHAATCYGKNESTFEVLESNVVLPSYLWEQAVIHKVSKFINIDSFTSKISDYPYLKSYHLSKNLFLNWAKIIPFSSTIFNTARIYHMYGPSDLQSKFIPFIINSLISKEDKLDLTSGIQKRDFIHVNDAASAIYTICISDTDHFEDIDIGTGESHSIKSVVKLIQSITQEDNYTKLNFGKLELRKNEIMDSKANTDRLKEMGWINRYDIDSGMKDSVRFHKIK